MFPFGTEACHEGHLSLYISLLPVTCSNKHKELHSNIAQAVSNPATGLHQVTTRFQAMTSNAWHMGIARL